MQSLVSASFKWQWVTEEIPEQGEWLFCPLKYPRPCKDTWQNSQGLQVSHENTLQETVCKVGGSWHCGHSPAVPLPLPPLVLTLTHPGAFSSTILTPGRKKLVSLPPQVPTSHHRALLLPLHSTKLKGPGMKNAILASNTSFSSL